LGKTAKESPGNAEVPLPADFSAFDPGDPARETCQVY